MQPKSEGKSREEKRDILVNTVISCLPGPLSHSRYSISSPSTTIFSVCLMFQKTVSSSLLELELTSSTMVEQEDGWPLGLRPLNARFGLARIREFNGSHSFSTLLTGSSSDSSSDLDSESTGSSFNDKSVTLGSLVGVSSIREFSRRSTRRKTAGTLKDQKNCKSRSWLFSMCSRLSTDVINTNHIPSVGHFLRADRRAANSNRRNFSPALYGTNDFSPVRPNPGPNPLFVGEHVAPQSSTSLTKNGGRRSNRVIRT